MVSASLRFSADQRELCAEPLFEGFCEIRQAETKSVRSEIFAVFSISSGTDVIG